VKLTDTNIYIQRKN
jgi:hypothetical protein